MLVMDDDHSLFVSKWISNPAATKKISWLFISMIESFTFSNGREIIVYNHDVSCTRENKIDFVITVRLDSTTTMSTNHNLKTIKRSLNNREGVLFLNPLNNSLRYHCFFTSCTG
jgi:hypothetical protein